MRHVLAPLSLLLVALPLCASPLDASPSAARGLTAVPGVQVGHHELDARPTGCTVILPPAQTIGAVDVRGGAPGSREQALLVPWNLVQHVDALVLAGGSAFGLDAASGTVRWLEEKGRGYETGVARVPIVPAAILFDLGVAGENAAGDASVRPGPECGFRAAEAASDAPVAEGNVGAGAGATVGKLAGASRAMKGGLGSDSLLVENDMVEDGEPLVVAALAVVNAVGDVIDPATGEVVAGLRDADGGLADARRVLLRGTTPGELPALVENTTLVVVATNAALDKSMAHKVAEMAHDGLARTIYPVHTPFDGDTVFVLATGSRPDTLTPADLLHLGALAAEVTARSVLRAVRAAEGLPGLPSATDLASEDTASE